MTTDVTKLTKAGDLVYWCEGCGHAHIVPAERWHWNGDREKPTLDPSVRHFYTHPETKKEITVCHYMLQGGVLKYCGDCQHQYKGMHRPLVPIPAHYSVPE